LTTSAEAYALESIATLPVRPPPCVGVSMITQFAPAASVAGQVFVSVNSALTVMLARIMFAEEVFVSFTVWALGTSTKVPLSNTTLVGLTSKAGSIVMPAATDAAPVDALIETAVLLMTEPPVAGNVPLFAPAATCADAGTGRAPGSLLARATEKPPAGAFALSVTVPVVV